jgi:iron(III) transport system substrate-binding protein
MKRPTIAARLGVVLAVTAATGGLLVGCGSSGGPAASSGGNEPLRVSMDEACAAAAEESGDVNYVASTDPAVFAEEIAPFTAKHPDFKINYTNLRSDNASQRLLAEAQTRHALSFDALSGDLPGFDPLFQQDMVRNVDWPALGVADDLVIKQQNGTAWRNYRLITGLGYNSALVSKDQLPNTWKELADPKWAGKVIVDPRGSYLGGIALAYGEQKTIDWFNDFMETTKPLIIQGATASAQKVISGEALLTTSAADANIRESQAAGAPIDIKYLDVVPTSDYHTVLMKDSPRPNKTACFVAWLASDEGAAQKAKLEFQNNDSNPPAVPPTSKLVLTDSPEALKTSTDTSTALAKIMSN